MSDVLTFDLGTSYFKVCLFDQALQLVAQQRIATPVEQPSPELAELPVSSFQGCLTAAVSDVCRQAGGLRKVRSVCFASQANSFTLLDADDEALIPFILWTDNRSRGTEASLRTLTDRTDFYRTTGVARIDHHFMLAKLRWLQFHEPEIVARMRRLCGLSDYFVWWLTGKHWTEAGLAGLSGLVDIHRLAYWAPALRHAELSVEQLPMIVRAGSQAGSVRSELAEKWGLPSNCRLVMGCLDQYAGAIGADNTVPGRLSETTGTVLATIRCGHKSSGRRVPGVFQGPAYLPGIYYQMVFSRVSAELLERYRNALPDRPAFAELDALAAQVPAGAEGLQLHPDAPDLPVSEMFLHRTRAHHRGHEVRAIMEGVAIELRRQTANLCNNEWPISVSAAGGAARSRLWLQIKSQILGCPVRAVDCTEPTSLGAALLTRLAHGGDAVAVNI